MIRLLAATFLFTAVVSAPPASGETISQNLAFQMRLVHDGVLDGRTDGKIGNGTRKAMTAYAEKFHVADDRAAIEADMYRRAASERLTSMDDRIWSPAIEGIKAGLHDPYSAHFTPLYFYTSSTLGLNVFCGKVNAKNLYGAYTGDTYFEIIVGIGGFFVQDATTFAAEDECWIGVSPFDFHKK